MRYDRDGDQHYDVISAFIKSIRGSDVDAALHYRMVDVSSVKELARRWFPKAYYNQPDKGMSHRALADIVESIRELEYYRRSVFVEVPGPTTEEARQAAADATASYERHL